MKQKMINTDLFALHNYEKKYLGHKNSGDCVLLLVGTQLGNLRLNLPQVHGLQTFKVKSSKLVIKICEIPNTETEYLNY